VVYLLSYFRTQDEALHLAWSEDALSWSALNDNRPLLRATVGNRSVRDPFIRACEDGFYHLLSTDSWWSPNLLHARSADLLEWEPWAILPVMESVAGTRNAWAPEFFYDAARRVYFLFWASITAGKPYQRIWYSETTDFRTLTAPAILFDPGYSVIDATVVEHAGAFYMIYKDERGENAPGTDFKAMRVATASDPRGPYTPQTGLVTPHLTEGPTVFRAGDRWRMLYDFFTDNRWGASESEDLLHWHPIDHLSVPQGARHGSVFTVTHSHWERLRKRLSASQRTPGSRCHSG
jgi:beta-xylosidase